MFENYGLVKPDSQRVTPSHPLTCLRLTNHSGGMVSGKSAVLGNAIVEI
jgi:hypothetical protein